jgi:hypothetical protein
MSSEPEEIIEALEIKKGKKLKPITLPDNSNDIHTGTILTPEQLEIQRLSKEMEQIKWERLREEQQRIGFDPYYQQQYMKRMTAIRDEANQWRYAQLAEGDQRQKEAQEVAIKERLAKNKQYQQHLERIEARKQKEIRKLGVYFTTSQEQFESMIAGHKNPEDSPDSYIIERSDIGKGWACRLHRYQKVIHQIGSPYP